MEHHLFAWLPHGTDLFWIFLLAVLLFGANKLPQLAKGLGKSLGEFKKAKEDFEKEIHSAASDTNTKVAETQPKVSGNLPEPVTPTPAPTATPIDASTKTT